MSETNEQNEIGDRKGPQVFQQSEEAPQSRQRRTYCSCSALGAPGFSEAFVRGVCFSPASF